MDDSSSDSSSSSSRERLLLIEDAATRTEWVPVTQQERGLIEKALVALAALAQDDTAPSASKKIDKLAISKVPGPGKMKRTVVYRAFHDGNQELWLGDDSMSMTARRIVSFPEHEGARVPETRLATDTKQERTLAKVVGADLFAPADVAALDAQLGVIWLQGYDANDWIEAEGEARTAIVHGLAAASTDAIHYSEAPFQHVVTLRKQTGTGALQVFRGADYRFWLADLQRGQGKPRSFRMVRIAGAHHAAAGK